MRGRGQIHSTTSRTDRREAITTGLLAARAPAEWLLTGALRRTARRKPAVFQRLGAFQQSVFRVAPDHSPIAFELRPDRIAGTVRIIRAADEGAGAAAIVKGDLGVLLGICIGALDADAAFFTRQVVISGDTAAVVTLHNTLEAAELEPADLIPLAPWASAAVARTLRLAVRLRKRATSVAVAAGQEA